MRPTLFVPITKVDLEKREVWGVAAEERTDKTRTEKFDYAASKPLFEEWIADFQKRTTDAGQGVSLGNIRYMHQPDAVGKAIAWQFDDAAKQIHLGAKIVDDACWEKIKEGVLTGFSIGGDYAKRWDDPDEPGVKRYAARPAETSVVDNPCMYGATFSAVKADGSTELRKFHPEVSMDLAAIRTRIDALLEKARAAEGGTTLRKGLYTVSELARYLEALKWLCEGLVYEFEKDETKQPLVAQTKGAIAQLADAFLGLAEAAVEDLTSPNADVAIPMALAAMGALAKAGARNSKADAGRIQSMHDLCGELGAVCKAAEAAAEDDAETTKVADGESKDDESKKKKAGEDAESTDDESPDGGDEEDEMDKAQLAAALKESNGELEKSLGDKLTKAVEAAVAPLQKQLGDVTTKVGEVEKAVGDIDKRLKTVEATPAAPQGIVRNAPGKEADGSGAPAPDLSKMTPEQRGIHMIKAKLAAGGLPLYERPQVAMI